MPASFPAMPSGRRFIAALVCAALAGCAAKPAPPPARATESVLPGTIRVLVDTAPKGVVVTDVAKGSALRAGDVVLRYNGVAPAGARHFYELMVESAPGSEARLEVLRGERVLELDVPVEEADTAPRA
jgi:S1-C subfamily serine protease